MKDLSNSESPEIMIVYCNLSSFTLLSQNRYVNRRHDFILVTGKVFGNLQMVVAPTPPALHRVLPPKRWSLSYKCYIFEYGVHQS